MAWLKCENTLTRTQIDFPLRKPITTIGRASGNDLVLDDPTLESTHANVMRQGAEHVLALTGRKGTLYVNGKRTRQAQLTPGDKILIGAWQVMFSDGDPTEREDEGPTKLPLDTLEALVELSAALLRDTDPARLFSRLLQGLVELTKAEFNASLS